MSYHENYMDQYVKTMWSDKFAYRKLNWDKIIRPQQITFQQNIFKCITENFHRILIIRYCEYVVKQVTYNHTNLLNEFPIEKITCN